MTGTSRRTVLAAAAAGSIVVGAPLMAGADQAASPIGPPPHPAGPKVFLDYDQVELDAAYDQSVYAPNALKVQKRWASNSIAALTRLTPPRRVAYGDKPVEQLDIYQASRPGAPIFFFVHGGAWRGTVAKDYAFLAEMVLGSGVNFVVPDFDAVQNVSGKLTVLADQVRRALIWSWKNAASFGGDPGRFYVGGHSSGGHLAAVLLATDWPAAGLPAEVIRGGLCISGMYDLAPVRLSSRSSYVAFDDASVQALSPQRHLDRLTAPLIVAHGTDETPEFQRQAKSFAGAVQDAGKPAKLLVAENYNHFELLETLANPYGVLGRALLSLTAAG